MEFLINLIYRDSAWLYRIIYQNNLFFIDFWTFNHFWSGAVLYLVITRIFAKNRFIIILGILAGYEIIEIAFRIFALNLFRPEIIKDQVNDVIVGLLGFALSYILVSIKSRYSGSGKVFGSIHPLTTFLSAATISYIWVGYYGYYYNFFNINFNGFSISAFMFWLPSMYGIIQIFEWLQYKKPNFIINQLLVWAIYFPLLIIIEYTSYYIVGLKESGQGNPGNSLIFGVIHGTRTLHIFYLLVPFIVIVFYKLLSILRDKALFYRKREILTIISRQP